jgi:hypothetical protein
MDIFCLLDASVPASLVGAIAILLVAITTLLTKKVVETKVLSSKLETEHNFEQRKQIMEVLSKYKVQLLNACEDLSHRLNNFDGNKNYDDMEIDGKYDKESYYFHSFVYRIICVFAWIKKIDKEMIYLDTTLASSKDLDFIKFLRLFPRVFCNLSVVGARESKSKNDDSFTRNKFELLADCILLENGIVSYASFTNNLPNLQSDLHFLFRFLDGVSPEEKRRRWHRLKLLHGLLIVFLNCYGYDFQKTDAEKTKKMLTRPFPSKYTTNYARFFKKYHLEECPEVQALLTLVTEFHPATEDSGSATPPATPSVAVAGKPSESSTVSATFYSDGGYFPPYALGRVEPLVAPADPTPPLTRLLGIKRRITGFSKRVFSKTAL